uniref:Extended synaptotagmin 1 n=1 Tax=Cyclopterus lumpus TaxID=8103 RepID=A0A8C2X5L7_CYCLU
ASERSQGPTGNAEKKALSAMETEGSTPKGISAVAVLWTFGKCLGALLPVYLAGYYRVSSSLLVFGMMVYTGWKHAREAKETRLRSAMQLLNSEEEYTSMRVSKSKRGLPAWVSFPDVEKVEWLNKVKYQCFPIQLHVFTFVKPTANTCLSVHYVGNVEIDVEVKRYFCKAGVKGIQLHGMMRVILEPLIGDVPIVGAVTMFFHPKLDINWTGLTNLLDIPGLNVMSDSMIMDAIASFLVLPNRLVVPLVSGLHLAQLRSPLPRGVVRIHLLEAQNLAAKDNYVKGVIAGLSDPYAILRVGPQTFTSKHFDNTDSPKWEEIYEVIVHEVPGQELEVEVYDKDPDQDDFLGRYIYIFMSLVCLQTPSGRVHFRLEWLALLPVTDRLEQVLKRNESVTSKTADPPSSAILVVYLDKAEALPMKKGNKEPNPVVQLSVQDITRESKTCYTTINPEWEEAFTFFIQDPRKQDIDIQVKDADRVQTLGNLTIPLSRLLSSSNLSLDQWFQLDNSGSASRIYINAVLRILWLDEERIPSDVSSNLESGMSKQLPQQTSPHPSFATEGLLRIHILAQSLVAKDNMMGVVKGKSDPYAKINVGGVEFMSNVIKENLNPVWNEMYEVVLRPLSGQEVQMDTLLFTLQNNNLLPTWLCSMSQVLQLQSLQSYQNKAVPSAALLFVHLERAHSLPLKKSGKEPKAGAELVLGETTYKTKLCERSANPQWNEYFYFLVHDPTHQMLVLSSGWDQPMGSLVIPVKELLAEPQLVLDQWFHLDGAVFESQILLRAELKVTNTSAHTHVLHSKMVDMISAGPLPCAAFGCGSGQVKLSLSYASQKRQLTVIVHACRGLLSQSKDGVDSYVSLMLLPDKSKATKRKTAVKKRDLDPEYNEKFEYDLSMDEMRFKRLSVSVKNNSASFRSRDIIGQVQIELAQVDLISGVTEW